MSKLGDFLRMRRKELGLSLREVEKACGISNAYLSMIESGKRTEPHPNILKKLAEVLNLKTAELYKAAGYLDQSEEEKEELKIEKLFMQIKNDPDFKFGTRLKDKLDLDAKRFIIEMYQKVKGRKLL